MIKHYLYLFAMLLLPLAASAQSDDFGIWQTISADKKLSKKLSLGVEADFRTRYDASDIERWSVGAGLQYKFSKWLKLSADYSFLRDNNRKVTYKESNGMPNKLAEYWGSRHRVNVSLTASRKIGNFELSLRERWQYTYRPEKTISERWDYDDDDYDGKPKTYGGHGKNVLRSRLQLTYDIPHSHFEPYISAEAYNAWSLQKSRYTAGIDWNVTKKAAVGLYYMYQLIDGDDDINYEPNLHVLGLEYNLKF